MASCRKCGAQIPDGSEYCPQCLTKLNTAKESESYLDSLLNSVLVGDSGSREAGFRKKRPGSLEVMPEKETHAASNNEVMEEKAAMPAAEVPAEEKVAAPVEVSAEEAALSEEEAEEIPSEEILDSLPEEAAADLPEKVSLSEEEAEEAPSEETLDSLPEEVVADLPEGISLPEDTLDGMPEEELFPGEASLEGLLEELSEEEAAGQDDLSGGDLPAELAAGLSGEASEELPLPEEELPSGALQEEVSLLADGLSEEVSAEELSEGLGEVSLPEGLSEGNLAEEASEEPEEDLTEGLLGAFNMFFDDIPENSEEESEEEFSEFDFANIPGFGSGEAAEEEDFPTDSEDTADFSADSEDTADFSADGEDTEDFPIDSEEEEDFPTDSEDTEDFPIDSEEEEDFPVDSGDEENLPADGEDTNAVLPEFGEEMEELPVEEEEAGDFSEFEEAAAEEDLPVFGEEVGEDLPTFGEEVGEDLPTFGEDAGEDLPTFGEDAGEDLPVFGMDDEAEGMSAFGEDGSGLDEGLSALLEGLGQGTDDAVDLDEEGLQQEEGQDEPLNMDEGLAELLSGFSNNAEYFTEEEKPEEAGQEDDSSKGKKAKPEKKQKEKKSKEEKNKEEKKKKEKKPSGVSKLWHKLFDNVKIDPSKVKPQPTPEEIAEKKRLAAEAKAKTKEEKEAAAAEKKEDAKRAKQEKQLKAKEAKEKKKAKKLEEAKLLLEEMETTRINRAGASIVFIFFAMIAVVIIVGTSIFSYSVSIKNAEYEFNRDEYTAAYNEIFGLDVKDEDIMLYDRIMTVMYVQKQLNSYYNYYEMKDYPHALDSLLKGLQRYEKYIELAVELEVETDLDSVRNSILAEAQATFSITEGEAMEILQSKTPLEYSTKVYKAVEKVNE